HRPFAWTRLTARRGPRSADRGRAQQMIRDAVADEGAGAGAADEISLVQELLVGAQHGQTRDAEVRRETARGWDPLSGAQTAVEDGAAQPVGDLTEDRHARGSVDGKMQCRHASPERVGSGYANWMRNGDGESTDPPDIARGANARTPP